MSGPLLDRIDLHVQVPAVRWEDLGRIAPGTSTATVRLRVLAARERQAKRGLASAGGSETNAALLDADLDRVVNATAEARELLGEAVERLGLSARAARRALRVARTIADLGGAASVGSAEIAESLAYRDAREPGRAVHAGNS